MQRRFKFLLPKTLEEFESKMFKTLNRYEKRSGKPIFNSENHFRVVGMAWNFTPSPLPSLPLRLYLNPLTSAAVAVAVACAP